uniref:Uncharacterized protein n=1 Tax=Setaria viridis TaxID=4556 RepID=A0A4U6T3M3_SETVI|nr:LOW QUALITY PROTEIN: hypothetical protein SEVIR_9G355200v2 [Setaria viridis]
MGHMTACIIACSPCATCPARGLEEHENDRPMRGWPRASSIVCYCGDSMLSERDDFTHFVLPRRDPLDPAAPRPPRLHALPLCRPVDPTAPHAIARYCSTRRCSLQFPVPSPATPPLCSPTAVLSPHLAPPPLLTGVTVRGAKGRGEGQPSPASSSFPFASRAAAPCHSPPPAKATAGHALPARACVRGCVEGEGAAKKSGGVQLGPEEVAVGSSEQRATGGNEDEVGSGGAAIVEVEGVAKAWGMAPELAEDGRRRRAAGVGRKALEGTGGGRDVAGGGQAGGTPVAGRMAARGWEGGRVGEREGNK